MLTQPDAPKRKFLSLLGLVVVLAATLVACSPENPTEPVLAIVHATLIDGTGAPAAKHRSVIVRGVRIEAVGPSETVEIPQAAGVIDASDRFLIPELWDAHVHTEARSSNLDLYLANGVTSLRDMGCDPGCTAQLLERQRQFVSGSIRGPRILVAGPNVDGTSPFARYAGHVHVTADTARETVCALAEAGSQLIKVRDWLTRDEYFAVVEAARDLGLPVDGHIPVSVSARECADAGQRTVEHGGSAGNP